MNPRTLALAAQLLQVADALHPLGNPPQEGEHPDLATRIREVAGELLNRVVPR